MADRYWVGGTGTWGTTTTNWAATSGGASGASVPTSADNVFFDVNSNTGTGAFTVTMANSPRVCNDLTISGLDGTMTLAGGTSIALNISGSLDWPATNLTCTYTGQTTFNATTTGKTVTARTAFSGGVTFNGVGGEWTLGFALTASFQQITVTNGTFDTSSSGNYAVTVGSFSSNNSNVRTINLNASTLSFNDPNIGWNMASSTNATLNAGTSTIICSGSNTDFEGGGKTYYNVSLTNTSGIAAPNITGSNTFNNLSISGRNNVGITQVSLSADQTINGTFTVSAGSGGSYRVMLFSTTLGTPRTLTCASIAAMTDVDFRDITIAGAHGTLSGTRLGDCKGNTNITFDAPKTVWLRSTGNSSWGGVGTGSWSLTSGGAAETAAMPLAQDTAAFAAATYPASGATTTINAPYNIGTIDMSLRTSNTMTLQTGAVLPVIYGNWINGTGITISGTGALTFAGRTTQTIRSEAKPFTQPITINSPSGSVTLQDAFTTATTRTTTLTSGTLDLQSYTLTTGLFSYSNTNTRTIAFGTGNFICTGTGTVWNGTIRTNLTITGTPVVNVTSAGSTAITVSTSNLPEANSISFNFTGGTYALNLFGDSGSSVKNVDFTGYAGTLSSHITTAVVYGNFKLSTGMSLTSQTNTLTFGATSGTQLITTNTKTMDFPIRFDGVGGTFQLQDALTVGSTRTANLANGTLDLQSYKLSTGLFSSSNSSTRTIAFGTGSIDCTGTGTVWTTSTVTGLTTTGTRVVNVTSVGSTAISVLPGVISEANSISFNFTGGTYALTLLNIVNYAVRNLDFTGFAGTWGVTNNGIIYGNLTLSTGMSLTAANPAIQFSATSGTKTITSNGKTMDFPITFNGVGGTWACQDALTLGSTRALTMTNGTLQLKDGVTSTVGSFVTTGTTLKYLQSTTSGVQATLSDLSGTNNVTYLSIQDSNATGGATFYAYDPTNVDAGNNTGWIFVFSNTGSFLMFF